jgi:hypothetical protein
MEIMSKFSTDEKKIKENLEKINQYKSYYYEKIEFYNFFFKNIYFMTNPWVYVIKIIYHYLKIKN